MIRNDIINTIGTEYLTRNIEGDEFSYKKEFTEQGLWYSFNKQPITNENNRQHYKLDLRFTNDNLSILVETKTSLSDNIDDELFQLNAYAYLEQKLTNNNIIMILHGINNNKTIAYSIIDGITEKLDVDILPFKEYLKMCSKPNEKLDLKDLHNNASKLNELLNKNGIQPEIRPHFVGVCILALQNGLKYNELDYSEQILHAIGQEVSKLSKNSKNSHMADKVFTAQRTLSNEKIQKLNIEQLKIILKFIEANIVGFINDSNDSARDILSIFFSVFNKFANKDDKNQAFTPNHITELLCKILDLNKNSIVFDPTCGSGSFLVSAMKHILNDCKTDDERNKIKNDNLFGIEYDKKVYELAQINMLMHGDGHSNIKNESCFDLKNWISSRGINVVMMNPPFNATPDTLPDSYVDSWPGKNKKDDPSNGLYFVNYVSECVKTGTLITILPLSCATSSDKSIKNFKDKLLKNHTLEAVFSLPSDLFYPGATVNSCCMIFKLGTPHCDSDGNIKKPTFFGYFKDDMFISNRNLGRIEKRKDSWLSVESEWLQAYRNRNEILNLSCMQKVNYNDEWCAEAYMQTDYEKLNENQFRDTVKDFLAYKIRK